jgi:hypothetical protein
MLTPATTARATEIRNSGDLQLMAPRLPKTTATIKVMKANRPENRLALSPATSKKDGCWKANWQEVAAKKIQIIFSDLVIAACSPGAVTPLTSSGLHFEKNLCMNFR